MAHEIIQSLPEPKKKKFSFKMPDLSGKFGISLVFGYREIFIGVAIAKIEMEPVVRKRKQRVFVPPGSAKFIKL